jgi:hypothetical protein
MDRTLASPRRTPIDQSIVESLVIPLPMVVFDNLVSARLKWDSPTGTIRLEALVLDRPHKPLGIRVRIGRSKRSPHNVHARIAQQLSHVLAPVPTKNLVLVEIIAVAVDDE